VVTLLAINATIAILFAIAVARRASDAWKWRWPPSWLRLVAAWLGDKGVWLVVLTVLWATRKVAFTEAAGIVARALYVVTLMLFTIPHLGALLYWVTGRATRYAPSRSDRTEVALERSAAADEATARSTERSAVAGERSARAHERVASAGTADDVERGAICRTAEASESTAESTKRTADAIEEFTGKESTESK
jgi:hypothetical protein